MTNKKIRLVLFVIIGIVIIAFVSFTLFNKNSKDEPNDMKSQLASETKAQPTEGNKDSKVLLVEFGDYKCPYCGNFERNIKPELEKSFIQNDKVEFRYVNVLLHGEESVLGAKAALAVNKYAPEKYWQFHHQLYQAQPKNKDDVGQKEWLTDALIQQQLEKLDITDQQRQQITTAYRKKDGEMAEHAQKDHALAKKFEVPQVPSLYVNGKRIENTTDINAIKAEINKALEQ